MDFYYRAPGMEFLGKRCSDQTNILLNYQLLNYQTKMIWKTLNKGWFLFHVERVISAVFTSGGFYKFTCHWVKPLAVPCLSFASANDFYLF